MIIERKTVQFPAVYQLILSTREIMNVCIWGHVCEGLVMKVITRWKVNLNTCCAGQRKWSFFSSNIGALFLVFVIFHNWLWRHLSIEKIKVYNVQSGVGGFGLIFLSYQPMFPPFLEWNHWNQEYIINGGRRTTDCSSKMTDRIDCLQFFSLKIFSFSKKQAWTNY